MRSLRVRAAPSIRGCPDLPVHRERRALRDLDIERNALSGPQWELFDITSGPDQRRPGSAVRSRAARRPAFAPLPPTFRSGPPRLPTSST